MCVCIVRHDGDVCVIHADVKEVYNTLDKIFNFPEIRLAHASRVIKKEHKVHRCLTNWKFRRIDGGYIR